MFCMSKIRRDILEDAIHNAFIKAFINIEKFDESKSSIRTWLCNIAKNVCIDEKRRKINKCEVLSGGFSDDYISAIRLEQINKELDEKEQNEFDERFKLVNSVLPNLNDRDNNIIKLKYFNGCRYKEIGIRLNKKESNVRKRGGRAIDKLRRMVLSTNG